MAVAYKLKLLSGALDGVEFSLLAGDTVFSIGRARDLHEGSLGATLSQADNIFYIPDERIEGAFLVHCAEAEAEAEEEVALTLRERVEGQWVPAHLPLNTVVHVAGLVVAVRREDQAWSDAVLDHRLPVPSGPTHGAGVRLGPVTRKRLPLRALLLLGAVLLVVGAGWVVYDSQRPATQIRTVEAVLQRSPYQYAVVADEQGRVYAFSDSPEAIAWGMRASQRSGRTQDVYLERRQEVARLGAVLEGAGLDYAVIRLALPQRPQVVVMASGGDDNARRKRAVDLMLAQMPYANVVDASVVSDAQLVSIVRAELGARGISTRVDPDGGRASVVNDVFLDDAALHAMSRYRDQFAREWGDRRIRVRIRLWDDLLKGRSYQYSPDQLLSVGEGRWEFSNAGSN